MTPEEVDPSLAPQGSQRRAEDRRRNIAAAKKKGANDSFLSAASVIKCIRRRPRFFLVTLLAVTLWQSAKTFERLYIDTDYQGGFSILIGDPINDRPIPNSGGGQGALDTLARNTFATDVPTLIQVLQSNTVIGPIRERILSEGGSANGIPSLSIEQVPADRSTKGGAMTQVLIISGESKDQATLDRFLKLTAEAYLEWATRQRQIRLAEGLKYLDRQAPDLERKRARIQKEMQEFRTKYSVVKPDEDAGSLRREIEAVQSRLTAQVGERRRFQEILAEVEKGNLIATEFRTASERPDSTSRLEVNLPNQAALEELRRLDKQIEEARSTFTPGTSLLEDLVRSRTRLLPYARRHQRAAVEAALKQNENATIATRSQIESLNSTFQRYADLLRKYDDIKQRLEIAELNRANHLKAREQFQLEIAQRASPWQVISSPSSAPTGAAGGLAKGIIQGLMLGSLAGAAAAMIRDRLDHVYHEAKEVKQDLQAPLLGHMPYVAFFDGVRREKRFLLQELDNQNDAETGYQRFHYQESLRNLYTSLRFINPDRKRRSVTITSSVPCEGKSLLNILLAKTISEMGQRVLLVDSDLRKPQVHHRLGLSNDQGLSTLLLDKSMKWESVVQNITGYEGWAVITAGPPPSDPPRLLGSERMKAIVKSIGESQKYDLILYDAPQTLGLADAPLIASHLEGIVLLVSLGHVDRDLPQLAIERINDSHVPLLGVITNAMKLPRGGQPNISTFVPLKAEEYAEEAWNKIDDESVSLRSRYIRKLRSLRSEVTRWMDG